MQPDILPEAIELNPLRTTTTYKNFSPACHNPFEITQIVGHSAEHGIEDYKANRYYLSANGWVWVSGKLNEYGQLGLGSFRVKEYISAPKRIGMLENIQLIVTGKYYLMALTKEGVAYSWGRNEHGQLGLGHTRSQNTPQLISGINKIKDIVCGRNHTIILTEDGSVYGCGSNWSRKLGIGDQGSQSNFVKIPIEEKVKAIINCGFNNSHSFFLLDDGRVKSCGFNAQGQLGLGHKDSPNTPQLIPNLDQVKHIACGDYHTVFIKEDGSVWGCGETIHFALGEIEGTDKQLHVTKPHRIKNFEVREIATVVCHRNKSFFIKKDGSVLETSSSKQSLISVPNINGVINIIATPYDTYFLTEDGFWCNDENMFYTQELHERKVNFALKQHVDNYKELKSLIENIANYINKTKDTDAQKIHFEQLLELVYEYKLEEISQHIETGLENFKKPYSAFFWGSWASKTYVDYLKELLILFEKHEIKFESLAHVLNAKRIILDSLLPWQPLSNKQVPQQKMNNSSG